MKMIFKSCTFWFAIASMSIILLHLTGQDNKNIILTFSNYPLYLTLMAKGFTLYLPAVDHAYYFRNLFFWFALHFVSFLGYGFIIDVIRVTVDKRKASFR